MYEFTLMILAVILAPLFLGIGIAILRGIVVCSLFAYAIIVNPKE